MVEHRSSKRHAQEQMEAEAALDELPQLPTVSLDDVADEPSFDAGPRAVNHAYRAAMEVTIQASLFLSCTA